MKTIISTLLVISIISYSTAQEIKNFPATFYHYSNVLKIDEIERYAIYSYIIKNEPVNEAVAVNLAQNENVKNSITVKYQTDIILQTITKPTIVYGENTCSVLNEKAYKYNCTTVEVKTEEVKKEIENYNQIYNHLSFIICLDTAKSNIAIPNKNKHADILYSQFIKKTKELLEIKHFKLYDNEIPETENYSFYNFTENQKKAVTAGANYIMLIGIKSLYVSNDSSVQSISVQDNKTKDVLKKDKQNSAYQISNAIFSFKIYSLLESKAIASKEITINKRIVSENYDTLINNLFAELILQVCNNTIIFNNQKEIVSGLFSSFYSKLNNEYINGYKFDFFIKSANADANTVSGILEHLKLKYNFKYSTPVVTDSIIKFNISECKFSRNDFISSFTEEANKYMKLEKRIVNDQFAWFIDTKDNGFVQPPILFTFLSEIEIELDITKKYPGWELPKDVKNMKFNIEDNTGTVLKFYTVRKVDEKIRIKLSPGFNFIKGRTYTIYFDDEKKVIECKY